MTKKKQSTASSKRTKRASSKNTLAEDIIEGLKQGIAHNRGEIKLRARQIYIPDDVDIRAVREKAGLSQADFAFRYGFNPRTLQEWEQGRSKPETAVLAYLKVIEKNPEGVLAALRK